MSRAAGALLMLPAVVAISVVSELVLGTSLDQFAHTALGLTTAKPEWTTPILDQFPLFHQLPLILFGTWLVYTVACVIADAGYTRVR